MHELCPACHEEKDLIAVDGCRECLERYGRFLLKANIDPFFYLARLEGGEVVFFEECIIEGDWILLIPSGGLSDHGEGFASMTLTSPNGLRCSCPRGISVKVEQIVWVADAPFGS